jgi:3-oxoacyl-[acyl-carrier-protein] synthase III
MLDNSQTSVGVPSIEYVLGSETVSIEELEARGLLETSAMRMREFGFRYVRVSSESSYTLALQAARNLIETSRTDPRTIDAIYYVGATPDSHALTNGDPRSAFHYPVAQLQYELEMTRAVATGISQVGCAGMMAAVLLARNFLLANQSTQRVLCVSSDVLPAGSRREMIYNAISDGACALLVEKGSSTNRILSYRQITKGYYWDFVNKKNEIAAAYFPTACTAIRGSLQDTGIDWPALARIVPHNVSLRSWEILLGLLGVKGEKLFAENIAKFGHVIAADNWMNLHDLANGGALAPKDKLLLFTFGFGANWSCMVLEH